MTKRYTTSSLAWTPIAAAERIGQESWPTPQGARSLKQGVEYCVQVSARADVDAFGHQIESAPTTIGNGAEPAFTYESRANRCEEARTAENGGEPEVAEEIYADYEPLSKVRLHHDPSGTQRSTEHDAGERLRQSRFGLDVELRLHTSPGNT